MGFVQTAAGHRVVTDLDLLRGSNSAAVRLGRERFEQPVGLSIELHRRLRSFQGKPDQTRLSGEGHILEAAGS